MGEKVFCVINVTIELQQRIIWKLMLSQNMKMWSRYHVRSAISNTLMHLISDNIYSQFMKVRIMLALNVIIKQPKNEILQYIWCMKTKHDFSEVLCVQTLSIILDKREWLHWILYHTICLSFSQKLSLSFNSVCLLKNFFLSCRKLTRPGPDQDPSLTIFFRNSCHIIEALWVSNPVWPMLILVGAQQENYWTDHLTCIQLNHWFAIYRQKLGYRRRTSSVNTQILLQFYFDFYKMSN